ncbi:rCG52073 [Rattus norvegicus]|uniref:RCG52073 n=1 Tax=Rattus norvegicus TaxID=10116 RepID=A6MGT8_RAT|nr:rCG52073 [Rattus norvegicus]
MDPNFKAQLCQLTISLRKLRKSAKQYFLGLCICNVA